MTGKMREALEAIKATRAAWVSTESTISDNEAFVHWRTAEALAWAGHITIVDDMDIYITDKGRQA